MAAEVDLLYLFLTGATALFAVLVACLVVFLAIKYRRRDPHDAGADIHRSLILELTWTVIPLVLLMVMLGWCTSLFYRMSRPPANAMDIHEMRQTAVRQTSNAEMKNGKMREFPDVRPQDRPRRPAYRA